MFKTFLALVTTVAFLAAPASAGNFEFDAGTGGNASIKGAIEGGSFTSAKSGGFAFSQSVNSVKGYGLSDVDLGLSKNVGELSSEGFSKSNTIGNKTEAQAFETRKLKFDNFTRFNVDVEKEFSGFSGF